MHSSYNEGLLLQLIKSMTSPSVGIVLPNISIDMIAYNTQVIEVKGKGFCQ
jgi:hypothetical protein